MRLKRYLLPSLMAVALTCAIPALAAFGLSEAVSGTGIPTGTTIPSLIGNVLKAVLGFVATLFLLLMVYAGFIYMTARGDEKKVGEAKKMITGAIIGVIIIAGSYAITDTVLNAITGAGNSGASSSSSIPDGSGPCNSGGDCNKETEEGTCQCTGADGGRLAGTGKPCTTGGFCTLSTRAPSTPSSPSPSSPPGPPLGQAGDDCFSDAGCLSGHCGSGVNPKCL